MIIWLDVLLNEFLQEGFETQGYFKRRANSLSCNSDFQSPFWNRITNKSPIQWDLF